MGETHVTLHEAAERLGVHYMTAYRYVRHGQLQASRTSSGWRVRRVTSSNLLLVTAFLLGDRQRTVRLEMLPGRPVLKHG